MTVFGKGILQKGVRMIGHLSGQQGKGILSGKALQSVVIVNISTSKRLRII